MKRSTSSKLALAILAMASFALADPTATDMDTARTLAKDGIDLRAKGDLKGAIEKLRAAHALGRTPVTGIELARTYAQAGQIVEALETAMDVARIPVAVDETERSRNARKDATAMANELRPRIPSVLVRITTQSAAVLSVSIDRKKLPNAAVGVPYRVNPGTHEVTARFEGGDEARGSVTLAEQESKTIELAPVPPKDVPVITSPSSDQPPKKTSAAPAIVSFAVGGGALVLGSITGLVAMADAKSLEGSCAPDGAKYRCGVTQYGKIDEANILATVSTIAFVTAGVATVFGLSWLLLTSDSNTKPKQGSVAPVIGLGWVGAHGTF